MKKFFLSFLIILALSLPVIAGRPVFRAGFQINNVETLEDYKTWRILGDVIDNSIASFNAYDAEVGDMVVCEVSESDNVNYFVITNIISRPGPYTLYCDVIWGTNNTPTDDDKKIPYQGTISVIGKDLKGGIAYPSIAQGNVSEYLNNSVQNLSIYNLGLFLSTNSGGSILPNSVGTNELKLAEVDQRYVKKSGDYINDHLQVNGNLTVTNIADIETVKLNNLVLKETPIQMLNSNSIITPYAFSRIQSTNGLLTLNSIQIETNNIANGTVTTIIGNSDINSVNITENGTVKMIFGLSFVLGKDDVIKFIFNGNIWNEIYRLDR